MAAKTPDTTTAEAALAGFRVEADDADALPVSIKAFKHIVLPFLTATTHDIDNGDTFTIGGETVIHRAAWEPETTADEVAVTLVTNQTIGFTTNDADDKTGWLHLWVNN